MNKSRSVLGIGILVGFLCFAAVMYVLSVAGIVGVILRS